LWKTNPQEMHFSYSETLLTTDGLVAISATGTTVVNTLAPGMTINGAKYMEFQTNVTIAYVCSSMQHFHA